MSWVLHEELASKQRGRPVYFHHWTGIGPAATEKLIEAARFDSAIEALHHPAANHLLSFYAPKEVKVVEISREDWEATRDRDDRQLCPCDNHPHDLCETCRGACTCHWREEI